MKLQWLAGFGLACFTTLATAQYVSPVSLPENGGIVGSGNMQRYVGMAVDGSGGPPFPAAFTFGGVTDGTPAGTRLLELASIYSIYDIAAIPGGVGAYMIASGELPGESYQLYYTDGTSEGTHIVSELIGLFPEGIRLIHGFVQQSIVVETQTSRLVVSDGTVAGTYTVLPGGGGNVYIVKISIGSTQGFAYAYDAQGAHIWRFGPSPADKLDITPLVEPPFYSYGLTAFGDRACFVAGTNTVGTFSGPGLYCTNGTVMGTVLIPSSLDGAPFGVEYDSGFQRFGSKLYFVPVWKPSPESPEMYKSPWITDGTTGGTHPLIVNSTMEWERIGTADGRVFYSGYPLSSGMPFSVTDGSVAGTVELFRTPWHVAGSYDTDQFNPVFGTAAFFLGVHSSTSKTETQVLRSDGTAAGTFALPPPAGVPVADWRPSVDCRPALVGHYLLVCGTAAGWGPTWSYDLDPIMSGAFD